MNMPQADLLKTARQRLHWSQRDLAQRLGVTPGYIALLEQSERSPSPDLWNRITRLFRVDPRSQDLFPGNATGPTQSFGHVTFTGPWLGYAPPPEFPIEYSLDPSWFAHIPFTVVTGAAGSGKTTFLRSWGEKVEVTGVRNDLLAIANAERRYFASNGKYVSLDELRTGGDISVPARPNYTYSAQTTESTFKIIAVYSGPDAKAPKRITVDETMAITTD